MKSVEEYKNYNIVWSPVEKYSIKRIGKGVLPKVMSGYFNTVGSARKAIDRWKPKGE